MEAFLTTLKAQPNGLPKLHGTPYCSDPNCQSCKELQDMQERIRLNDVVSTKAKAA